MSYGDPSITMLYLEPGMWLNPRHIGLITVEPCGDSYMVLIETLSARKLVAMTFPFDPEEKYPLGHYEARFKAANFVDELTRDLAIENGYFSGDKPNNLEQAYRDWKRDYAKSGKSL